jgi:four helix bundle protein
VDSTKPTRKFDLEERLIDFSVMIIDLVELLPDTRAGNLIANQLLRSGTSPASNYGEALAAESRRDFIHKMQIGLKELRETHIWLKTVDRKKLIKEQDRLNVLLDECNQLVAIFVSSIATARRNSRVSEGNVEYRITNIQ